MMNGQTKVSDMETILQGSPRQTIRHCTSVPHQTRGLSGWTFERRALLPMPPQQEPTHSSGRPIYVF
ncbi:hypothetical protein ACFP1I_32125 [Dyadobacter subterraneus]|uniref:Uncharacterized protein n=1 Tax=Dyadobacter subterraneus TaxID=2773304 RepID=A0ABR9WDW5_9BACT|nr:hypothetical protein [Dyadobacter subterraneus]MBE9463670.1 hypothetical protein [Dyadobacter subterraneus]